MLSEIIKGSLTSCCFPEPRKRLVTGLSNVVSGWVDYYVTTTETPRELVIMSRCPDIRLSLVRLHAEANALLMAAPNGELTNCDRRSLLARSPDFQ
jgi:hypothetical protein